LRMNDVAGSRMSHRPSRDGRREESGATHSRNSRQGRFVRKQRHTARNGYGALAVQGTESEPRSRRLDTAGSARAVPLQSGQTKERRTRPPLQWDAPQTRIRVTIVAARSPQLATSAKTDPGPARLFPHVAFLGIHLTSGGELHDRRKSNSAVGVRISVQSPWPERSRRVKSTALSSVPFDRGSVGTWARSDVRERRAPTEELC